MLSEVREFVRSALEVFKIVPLDYLAVFVVGLLALGAVCGIIASSLK